MKKSTAYFTVEAALVLPLVMSALIMTVFLFVFQYDRCLLEQDVGMLILYADTLETADADELSAFVRRRASEVYWDKYVFWEMNRLDITVDKPEIKIEAAGSMTLPLPEWNLFGGEKMWEARADRRAARLSPASFLRMYRRIKGGK